MREVCEKKNKAVLATDEGRVHDAERHNGNGARHAPHINGVNGGAPQCHGSNGTASNGNGANGSSSNGTLSTRNGTAMPDVQETVLAATQTALLRKMPLSTALRQASAAGIAAGSDIQTAAHEAFYDCNGSMRQVDIMKSLGAIRVPMEAVEEQIEQLITTPVKVVGDMAAHTMSAGGKRLRPALTILAAQLCGEDTKVPAQRTLLCAAAVELMHTTALIHDDVVDSAAVRRGKPAANLIWGNETSVLVGDYLFAQVFVTVAQPEFVDLLPAMAQATSQLCAGELLETQTRGMLSMPEEQYCDIIALKTAALTECACRLGGLAVFAAPERTERLARFGREIGMAFQIVDDCFDVISTEGRVGKPVGNDIREGDITLPMLRAMQVCSERDKEMLRAVVGKDPISDEEVATAIQILRGCDAVEYSMSVAAGFVQSAKAQLDDFGNSAARAMMYDIADYTLSRDK
ncbi:MAG TPA: polyprenyl synthetase family protein [Abditibacteriaceae bacterium]|jgi:geranylgeranyl pyrophosphate synthase